MGQSVETLKRPAEKPQGLRALPGLWADRRGGAADPDARVDDHVTGREPEDGVQVELRDLGVILSEPREPPYQVDERVAICCRAPTEAGDQATGLPLGYELARVRVSDRRKPELCLADQLGQDAARAERNKRPEDGILDETG